MCDLDFCCFTRLLLFGTSLFLGLVFWTVTMFYFGISYWLLFSFVLFMVVKIVYRSARADCLYFI